MIGGCDMSELPPDDVLLHPVRMRIVVALAGRSLTASQLRAELADVPQATLYQHLGRLTRAGTLRVVEERPARGAVERVYALGEGGAGLNPARFAQATPEELGRYYATFIAALLADGSHYLRREGIDPLHDGFGFREVVFLLSDDELRAMGQALNAALLPFLKHMPAPDRRRYHFSTIFIPQPETPGAPERAGDPTNPEEPDGPDAPTARGEIS